MNVGDCCTKLQYDCLGPSIAIHMFEQWVWLSQKGSGQSQIFSGRPQPKILYESLALFPGLYFLGGGGEIRLGLVHAMAGAGLEARSLLEHIQTQGGK